MREIKEIKIEELRERRKELKEGDIIALTGLVYSARDAAHKRLEEMLLVKKKLELDIKDKIIYYTGPTPAKPGMVIGSCGPTSSYRMDKYVINLTKLGLLGTIGKGERGDKIKEELKNIGGIYFMAIGGAGALACKYVKKVKDVAFEDLGCESIKEIYIEKFPVIVSIV